MKGRAAQPFDCGEQTIETLERRYKEALAAEREISWRWKTIRSWRRVGVIAQITLFFVGFAVAELVVRGWR